MMPKAPRGLSELKGLQLNQGERALSYTPMSDIELTLFLMSPPDERDIDRVREEWREHTRYDLFDAFPVEVEENTAVEQGDTSFSTWQEKREAFKVIYQVLAVDVGRFVFRGRQLKYRSLRQELHRYNRGVRDTMGAYSAALTNGQIGLQEFYRRMTFLLTDVHYANAAVARGGWRMMDDRSWALAAQYSKKQHEYLRNLCNGIKKGTVDIDSGRFWQRTRMYAQSGYGTYQQTLRAVYGEHSYTHERRVTDPSADHCECCLDQEDKDWQPIGDLLPIGDCTCLFNCHCYFEFKREGEDHRFTATYDHLFG